MKKLNAMVTDTATGMKGLLVMLHMEMNGDITYGFQPATLNPKSKLPTDLVWMVVDRIQGGEEVPMPDLPRAVLGTQVMDKATGFTGMAVSMSVHATGCVHFNVQCKGQDEDGNAIKCQNFSILRLEGPAITAFEAKEPERASKRSPGPALMPVKQYC